MRSPSIRRLMATIAAASLIGAAAGLWPAPSPTAGATAASALPSGHYGGTCTSYTWLWLPAMRRGGR